MIILRTANHQGIQDYKKAIHDYSDKLDQSYSKNIINHVQENKGGGTFVLLVRSFNQ